MVYGMMAAAIEAEITDPEHFLGKSANKFFISLLTEDLQSLITNYFEVGETDPKDVLTITDITLNFVKNTILVLLITTYLFRKCGNFT